MPTEENETTRLPGGQASCLFQRALPLVPKLSWELGQGANQSGAQASDRKRPA
jgi:hypothetical protein